MAARKRKKTKSSVYVMSKCRFDEKKQNSKNGIVGKVKSNFVGTCFTIYEETNEKVEENEKGKNKKEVCVVIYEPNLFGLKGPRKMTLLFPTMPGSPKTTQSNILYI